jgi:hypothetical protein
LCDSKKKNFLAQKKKKKKKRKKKNPMIFVFLSLLLVARETMSQGVNCTDQGGCIWACDNQTNRCADAVGQVICIAAFST